MLFSKLMEIGKRYFMKPAIVHNKRTISYGQLIIQINRLAKELERRGIGESTRVAILSNNSIEYLISFYSIAKLGGMAIPIDMRFKANEVEKMFQMFDVQYCMYSSNESKAAFDNMNITEELKQNLNVFNYEEIDDEKLLKQEFEQISYNSLHKKDFLIQYTSGSTGVPKGIIHTQLSLSHINANWASTIGISSEDEFLCTYVLTSAHATDIFILPALLGGSTLHVMDVEKVFPRFVANYIYTREITVYTSLDYFFRLLNDDENLKREYFQSLKHVFSGSAPLTEDVGQAFYNKFHKYLGNIYGMAETGPSHVNLHTDKELSFSSIGKVLNGMKAKIVNNLGEESAIGEIGEVLLQSKSNANGYWNNEGETSKVFIKDGWVSTKDLGWKDQKGNYHIVGRKSQFVNINGNKVSPDEVEEIINGYEEIKECAVIGVCKGTPNERLVAYVVTKKEEVNLDDLHTYCGRHLAAFKLCKEYIPTEELPRGENGKLLKKALENLYVEQKKNT